MTRGGGGGGGWRRRAASSLALGLLAGGCGASAEPTRYPVSLPAPAFPARQQVGAPARLRITVRNDGGRALPDVAVSIDSFSVADRSQRTRKPVWLVDRAPGSGIDAGSAADQTWSLGRLAPGATASFLWRVTPVRPGTYVVAYRVDPALRGDGAGELAGGRPARGTFTVTVSRAPADARVDPATGRVIRRPGPTGAAAAG